ncbi:hypothetical protein [Streptomyces prasinopilosus]|uniref:hypothetical protein n=1 Tax=Streptomyces prasinopilosus TaxID=67344 RepID=UPI0006EBD2ED|nr:hypothetical protein [Streptomyces prasinopilosus]
MRFLLELLAERVDASSAFPERTHMNQERFTEVGKTRRNLRWTTIATVPCVLILLYLIAVRKINEAWVGIGIVAAVWALLAWRFKGVGTDGLPPQR